MVVLKAVEDLGLCTYKGVLAMIEEGAIGRH